MLCYCRCKADDVAVRVSSNYALSGGQAYGVSSIVTHEDFSGKYYSDIALLRTSTKMFITPHLFRVVLAYRKVPVKSVGRVTGFGSNQVYYLLSLFIMCA